MATLPHRTLVVFEGQEHNAMDKIPQQFAETVTKFLRERLPAPPASSDWLGPRASRPQMSAKREPDL